MFRPRGRPAQPGLGATKGGADPSTRRAIVEAVVSWETGSIRSYLDYTFSIDGGLGPSTPRSGRGAIGKLCQLTREAKAHRHHS